MKKERKAEARSEVVMRLEGSVGLVVRDKRELRIDQSWRGLSLKVAILDRKYFRLEVVMSLETRRAWSLKGVR